MANSRVINPTRRHPTFAIANPEIETSLYLLRDAGKSLCTKSYSPHSREKTCSLISLKSSEDFKRLVVWKDTSYFWESYVKGPYHQQLWWGSALMFGPPSKRLNFCCHLVCDNYDTFTLLRALNTDSTWWEIILNYWLNFSNKSRYWIVLLCRKPWIRICPKCLRQQISLPQEWKTFFRWKESLSPT